MSFLKRIVTAILTAQARMLLRRHEPRIIAITGSVGKTTTKDAIHTALAPHLSVRASAKSFNSEIGVPLTILGLDNAWNDPLKWLANILRGAWRAMTLREYSQYLILEVGADRPGDIRRTARWLRPDIVVVTGVPDMPVHVEYFASPEELLREKLSLVEHLKPGGVLIVNGDDERMQDARRSYAGRSFAYGYEDGRDTPNDYVASHESVIYEHGVPSGVRFRISHNEQSVPVVVAGALGAPRVYGALAAVAVARTVGIDMMTATQSLAAWTPPAGRLRIIEGLRGSVILDDTYNASPVAVLSALDTLATIARKTDSSRKIAILGDMLELGEYSDEAHRAIGERAAQCADMLITVGYRSRAAAQAALDAGMPDECVRQYEHNESARAGKELEAQLREGDIVLIKGSQSMRMEKAVLEIMADPASAASLIVRQEEEWTVR